MRGVKKKKEWRGFCGKCTRCPVIAAQYLSPYKLSDKKQVHWASSTFPMIMHGGWSLLYAMDLEVLGKARQVERNKPIIVGCRKAQLEMEAEGILETVRRR